MKFTEEWFKDYERRKARAKAGDVWSASPKPEQDVRPAPLGKEETAGRDTRRSVTVSSYRVRLCDPDNLCVKPFIDGLRYCGVIEDDTSNDIILEVRQFKVATKKEERTEIEIA